MKKIQELSIYVLTMVLSMSCLYGQGSGVGKPDLVVQRGHIANITALAFSPDGKVLASGGGRDSEIRLWNVEKGLLVRTLEGHTNPVFFVGFSSDGKILVSASDDKTIRIWNSENGRMVKSFDIGVTALAISPDRRFFVSGSNNGAISIWDIESGLRVKSLKDRPAAVTALTYSSDGNTIVSGTRNGIVDFWDLETAQAVNTIESDQDGTDSILFFNNGQTLVTGKRNLRRVALWNNKTRDKKESNDAIDDLEVVILSPDRTIIATRTGNVKAGNYGTNLISVATGKLLGYYGGHENSVESIAISPDGKTLASGSIDRTVKLWNLESGKQVFSLGGNLDAIGPIAFSNDGRTLISSSCQWDNTVKVWNLETGAKVKSIEIPKPAEEPEHVIESLAFSADGKSFSAQCRDTKINIWNTYTGELVNFIPSDGQIVSVAFSPDGRTIASAESFAPKLWNRETGKLIRTFEGHDKMVLTVAFSPNGKMLASGSWDETIKLWNIQTGRLIKSLENHDGRIAFIGFSPNGKMLASFEENHLEEKPDYTIKLWDLASGLQVKSLEGHSSSILAVSFSADGKFVVSGSQDETIRIWETETGRQVKALTGHRGGVGSAFLSPNGRVLVSSGQDGTVKFWDLPNNRTVATLVSLGKNEWVVTTPDGQFDTNKLENPKDLYWTIPDAPFTPLSFEIFMRDYYEPNLLPRLLKCTEQNNCDREFKPVRNLAELNRTQPKVAISDITAADSRTVKVTVEVEDAASEYQKGKDGKGLQSGVYDLRLFRDGQLVGYSTAEAKLKDTFRAYKNFDDELAAWQAANRVELVNGKKTFTFDVKLPKNSSAKDFNFTAYAFNSDRVKSENANKTYTPPTPLARANGKAYLVTIGVNASDNPAFSLRYAANDARKLQEVAGARLKAEVGPKYSEVIQVPLISDADTNDARKEIIKGVFAMLAGRGSEVSKETGARIERIGKIPAVEPEDTVIIAFSGHGYADQNGIFYMLPADIPAGFTALTPDVLSRTISSDELSLWMRDITAQEMIMIVDACHSAAAVQGDGFKPGPMGSRGLGQLAYDKDMKILSATQSDNVAFEAGRLQQGLLSYALIQDGIVGSGADANADKKISTVEWLSYAEKRVPQLYQDVRDGKHNVVINGNVIKAGGGRGTEVFSPINVKSSLNLQQPSLFNFKRRAKETILFDLR